MKAICRRLRRLEAEMAPTPLEPKKYFPIIISALDRKRSLMNATYRSNLCKDGTLYETIDLTGDPDAREDVTDMELEAWVQEQRARKEWLPEASAR